MLAATYFTLDTYRPSIPPNFTNTHVNNLLSILSSSQLVTPKSSCTVSAHVRSDPQRLPKYSWRVNNRLQEMTHHCRRCLSSWLEFGAAWKSHSHPSSPFFSARSRDVYHLRVVIHPLRFNEAQRLDICIPFSSSCNKIYTGGEKGKKCTSIRGVPDLRLKRRSIISLIENCILNC